MAYADHAQEGGRGPALDIDRNPRLAGRHRVGEPVLRRQVAGGRRIRGVPIEYDLRPAGGTVAGLVELHRAGRGRRVGDVLQRAALRQQHPAVDDEPGDGDQRHQPQRHQHHRRPALVFVEAPPAPAHGRASALLR